MDLKLFADVIGWIGSVEVVLAYMLVSYEKIAAVSQSYQWLNLTGGILLLVNTAYYGAYPSAFTNLIWFEVALFAIYRIILTKSSGRQ